MVRKTPHSIHVYSKYELIESSPILMLYRHINGQGAEKLVVCSCFFFPLP